ncbi:hypothetical protein ACIQV3_19825 [Streptomyces sp. NPDC099050]|uniref:hypothetical protein n=1 Tax=Streptomyces sp. NPDC099050 TaxID=3366100 RepID=UPI00380FF654
MAGIVEVPRTTGCGGDPAASPGPAPVPGPPGEADVRDALGDWRQDAALIGLLPVLCWPALIGALVTRPAPLKAVLLVVLCLPVLVALRELYVARRVRGLLRAPELRWVPYEAEVVRGRGLPPLLVLGRGGSAERVLTLGPLGRRVLPPRAWPPPAPALPPPAPSGAPGPSAPLASALPPSGPSGPLASALPPPGASGAPGSLAPVLPPSGAPGAPGPSAPTLPPSGPSGPPVESDAPGPPPERFVWLAGDPGPGAVVWVPRARELGLARRPWPRGALSRRRPPR